MPLPSFTDVAELMHVRRTHKTFSGAAVPRADIERLLELARWAPNHRLSQPWRFYVLDQPAIARFCAFLRSDADVAASPDPAKATAKLTKLLERLPQAGALIQTTWQRNPNPDIDREDQYAVAAAMQNILLAATAMGLASYWSTSAAFSHPNTLSWCGVDGDHEGFLGCLWLGYPVAVPPTPARQPVSDFVCWL